jgi:3-hydroxybutyryl-CoA dehydrogenase
MKVTIVGENPFVEMLYQACDAAGHMVDVYLVETIQQATQSGTLIEHVAAADVVIELVHESLATKKAVWGVLADQTRSDALVLVSALTCSTTQAASWIPHPERVIGFGVLPPSNSMVELAMGLNSAETNFNRAKSFWQSLDITPVVVKDSAGLVRARVVCCIINEAVTALQEGVATAADIDQAMQLGTNYPHGPLRWADLLGVDFVLGVMNGLYAEWQEDRYRPAPLLRQMVFAGWIGRKSGCGFYQYY